jgi:hypothetical protein
VAAEVACELGPHNETTEQSSARDTDSTHGSSPPFDILGSGVHSPGTGHNKQVGTHC